MGKRVLFTCCLFISLAVSLFSQNRPEFQIKRTFSAPKIDGLVNDSCWFKSSPIHEFTQYVPNNGKPASQVSDVYVLYSDEALFIGAVLYDKHPDSIKAQLGARDTEYMNTDYFTVSLDPIGDGHEAYILTVTSANVQIDSKSSDETFDAVWQSKTARGDFGWSVEMKIPYSAIRFPKKEIQTWRMQFERYIRRNRELSQWVLIPKDVTNVIDYYGNATGVEFIDAPLRLSVSPYISTAIEHYPYNNEGKSNYSHTVSGGADLKVGLSESFTLDVTLLPDFSQVKSDNQVKNLSAFETTYEEQRPFFNEAMDLFKKGNVFYSRRIGGLPVGYYQFLKEASYPGIEIVSNPVKTNLLNAIKISGRTRGGTGLGFLNAIVDETHGEVITPDSVSMSMLTSPKTNYNVLVFDQNFGNQSNIYFINTNVYRDTKFLSSNVLSGGLTLNNKSVTYGITLNGSFSQKYKEFKPESSNIIKGYRYDAKIEKKSGAFRWSLQSALIDDHYDANDLGLVLKSNYSALTATAAYNVYEPFWKLRDFHTKVVATYTKRLMGGDTEEKSINISANTTTNGYLSLWSTLSLNPYNTCDYYETRDDGRYYLQPAKYSIYFGFSSDYRKPLAFDGSLTYAKGGGDYRSYEFSLGPVIRLSNHAQLNFTASYQYTSDEEGYVRTKNDQLGYFIIFGSRNITGSENSLSLVYAFTSKLVATVWLRHYWLQGDYYKYWNLNDDGTLNDNDTDYNADFSFNSLNFDFDIGWEFAPGSKLSLTFKRSLTDEMNESGRDYFYNLNRVIDSPQLTNASIKFLYYIDYQNVRSWFTKNKQKKS